MAQICRAGENCEMVHKLMPSDYESPVLTSTMSKVALYRTGLGPAD